MVRTVEAALDVPYLPLVRDLRSKLTDIRSRCDFAVQEKQRWRSERRDLKAIGPFDPFFDPMHRIYHGEISTRALRHVFKTTGFLFVANVDTSEEQRSELEAKVEALSKAF